MKSILNLEIEAKQIATMIKGLINSINKQTN